MARNRDDILRERIQAALDSDARTRAYDLRADVINGAAQITGIVDVYAEKQQVGKIVSNIKGVRALENGVTVSADGAVYDRDVTREVMEELSVRDRIG